MKLSDAVEGIGEVAFGPTHGLAVCSSDSTWGDGGVVAFLPRPFRFGNHLRIGATVQEPFDVAPHGEEVTTTGLVAAAATGAADAVITSAVPGGVT